MTTASFATHNAWHGMGVVGHVALAIVAAAIVVALIIAATRS